MDPRSSDEASRRDVPSFIEPRPPLINNPFMRPRPTKGINLLEKFEEDSDIIDDEPELVQVYLRMKPCKAPSNLYYLRSDKCLVTSLDTTTAGHGRRTQHNVPKMYTFSRIFKPECSQKEVFEEVVKGNLKRLVDGHSFTLLTYGASGSGKTYTLMGTVNSPGLVPASLEYLFKLVDAAQTPIFKPSENGIDELSSSQQDLELQRVKRLLNISASFREKYRRMSVQLRGDFTGSSVDLTERRKHYVWVSFVEIYNEAIYDLLAPPEMRAKLRLREDSTGNVYVKGVTQTFVRSSEEAYDVLVAGKHHLVVAATGIHANSSRSHCIFTITMLTENEGEIHTSHVRLCDLAGCERQRAARNTGLRMRESRAINSSLHVLERCLHMLRRKQASKETAMVPYRESKLTRLLGSGLSGARGEAVTMVVTVNPAPQYAHETRHVLALATVAKDIQINNTIMDPSVTSLETTQDTTMQDYAEEIMRLRTENERLHFELLQAQSCIAQLRTEIHEKRLEDAKDKEEIAKEVREMVTEYYEKQLGRLRNEMNEREEELEDKIREMEDNFETMLAKAIEEERKVMEEHYKTQLVLVSQKGNVQTETFTRSPKGTITQDPNESIHERDEENDEEKESDDDNMNSDVESDADNLDDNLDPAKQLRKSILHKEVTDKLNESLNNLKELRKSITNEEDTDDLDESLDPVKELRKSILHKEVTDNLNESLKNLKLLGKSILDEEDTDNMDESLDPVKQLRKSILHKEVTDNLNESLKHLKLLGESILNEEGTDDLDESLDPVKQLRKSILHKEITDNLNESLKPVKELRKSVLLKENSKKKEAFVDLISESSEGESDEEEILKEPHKVVSLSKDSLFSDEDSETENQNGQIEDAIDSNTLQSTCKINGENMSAKIEVTDYTMNTSVENDRSESEEMFNVSTKLNATKEVRDMLQSNLRGTYFVRNEPQTNDEEVMGKNEEMRNVSAEINEMRDKEVTAQNLRGTYFVRNESQNESNVDQNMKNFNTVRGTYFVADREMSLHLVDIDDNEKESTLKSNVLENKESPAKYEECPTEIIKPEKKPDTLVSKLLKSFKMRQSSESSLKQFEQLELAVNDSDTSTHAVKSFEINFPTQKLNRKKYFDDSNEFSKTTKIDNHGEEPNDDRKGNDTKLQDVEGLSDDIFKISSAAKKQERRLLYDSPEILATSPEKQAKAKILEASKSVESIILTPKMLNDKASNKVLKTIEKQSKYFEENLDDCVQQSSAAHTQEKRLVADVPETSSIPKDEEKVLENTISLILTPKVKEAHLYYTDSDKVIQKDILLSKSPSIVKDDIPHEYEPSVAVQKILGESFKKPEILSSTRKERLAAKKPESVDLFESPLSSNPKTNNKTKDIEIVSHKNADEQGSETKEIISLLNHKEKAKKIAHEFIEDLVAGQTIKELEVAKNHSYDKPTDNLTKQDDTGEIKSEIRTLCITSFTEQSSTEANSLKSDLSTNVDELKLSQLNDTQTSKGNNTVDEFEKIVNNLSNIRATEFELLVSEESNTASTTIEPTREVDIPVTSKDTHKKDITEKTKKFDEVKYNLRNKGKSYVNFDDNIEAEKAAGSKIRSTTKRSLRLRRRRNVEDNPDEDTDKLKDILNLEKEFCDVTMGLPATERKVKDIESPEKNHEEENVPPLMGAQSCPSKSVTRSRRKLFTPRAEALEESPCQGNSNERINVPRPAYHGARARRRL